MESSLWDLKTKMYDLSWIMARTLLSSIHKMQNLFYFKTLVDKAVAWDCFYLTLLWHRNAITIKQSILLSINLEIFSFQLSLTIFFSEKTSAYLTQNHWMVLAISLFPLLHSMRDTKKLNIKQFFVFFFHLKMNQVLFLTLI